MCFGWAKDYFVDPIKGKMSNAGSSVSPWSTLEAVFANGKSFQPGDTIFLRRGYHGGPIIKGNNSGKVTIKADPGHVPVVKWLKLSGASNWIVEDIFINAQSAAADGNKELLQIQNKSNNNILNKIFACSTQAPMGWEANEQGWLDNSHGGVHLASGTNNVIKNSHFFNVGNGIKVSGSNNVIEYNTLENFHRDGFIPLANGITWQYNFALNAIMHDHTKPVGSRYHRDFIQSWNGAKSDMVFRGNFLIAVGDPSLPVAGGTATSKGYLEPRMPGLAGWDGPFTNYIVENNVVVTDSGAGIWLNAATDCKVINNTCVRLFSGSSRDWSTIRISQKTTNSRKSTNNIVFNNISENFDFKNKDGSSSVSASGQNLRIKKNQWNGTFLNAALPKLDMHLKSSASGAIGKANKSRAPGIDFDENKRDGAPDIGAFEHGFENTVDNSSPTTPGKPRVIAVPGLGFDLLWAASSDNRSVKGYDIYRNGKKVARTRVGSRFFDLFSSSNNVSYTIVAFDFSGNRSPASPVGRPGASVDLYSLTVNSGSGEGLYEKGTVVDVSANTPPAGKQFDKWTGDTAPLNDINAATTKFTVPANNSTITANYKDIPVVKYNLSVSGGSGAGSYTAGTVVNIKANPPGAGKVFDKWTGNTAGVEELFSSSTKFTMPAKDSSVTATYRDATIPEFTLTVNNGTGDGSYIEGAKVNIKANAPANGKLFDKWTGDTSGVADVNSPDTTYTMPAQNSTLTANYKNAPVPTYQLTVSGGTGSGSYPTGTQVDVTADTPPDGKLFDRWTGDTAGLSSTTNASTKFTMPAKASTITASYKDAPVNHYTLIVNKGNGDGSYVAGSTINLQADAPAKGETFDRWTGNVGNIEDVHQPSTQIIMPPKNISVTASFKQTLYTLTVKNGSGDGDYGYQTKVSISADPPAEGKVFDQWTGATLVIDDPSAAQTTVNMPIDNVVVEATYKNILYTLKVDNGSGSGEYAAGRNLNISAGTPPTGEVFDYWSGDVEHLEDFESASTSLIMPAKDIQLSAVYKPENADDLDGDGLSNEYELQYGLDPNDPSDALTDLDGDGLDNLKESELGSDPNDSDSDDDGLTDGEEFKLNTSLTEAATPRILKTDIMGLPLVGQTLHLFAYAVHPGGKIITAMSWKLIEKPGTAPDWDSTDLKRTTFNPGVKGKYKIQVIAHDENGRSSDPAFLTFLVFELDNFPPVADAGVDQHGLINNEITLYGMNSSDLEDVKPVSYSWSLLKKPEGSSVNITNSNNENASFTPGAVGTYAFGLVVKDSGGLSSEDPLSLHKHLPGKTGDAVVYIKVMDPNGQNHPRLNTDTEINAEQGTSITLKNTSSDLDGDDLSYQWTFVSKPDGSQSRLNDYASATPTFTPDQSGVFILQVTVKDESGHTEEKMITIHTEGPGNHFPIPDAGENKILQMPAGEDLTIPLTGSASDPDDNIQSINWSQIEGPVAQIDDPTSLQTSFTIPADRVRKAGLYRFELMVTDATGLSQTDEVIIIVNTTAEHVPILKQFRFPELVNENGSHRIVMNRASRIKVDVDPMGDENETLTVFWTQISGPSALFHFDSESDDDNVHNEILVIHPKTEGEFVFKVFVDDGMPRSEEQTISFKADSSAVLETSPVLENERVEITDLASEVVDSSIKDLPATNTDGPAPFAGGSGSGGCFISNF